MSLRFGLLMSAFLCLVGSTEAQDVDSVDEADAHSKKLFNQFDETAKSLEMVTEVSDEKLEWVKTPLFRFSTEGTVFGSVYIWHDASKRLAVVGTIGSIPINDDDYEFVELHLLKPQAIQPVVIPGGRPKQWDPDVTELSLRPVPGAPNVAGNDRGRLVQMRAMARQFSSSMVAETQTNQLRLLPQPLYRYEDSSSERDGGLFAFVWDKGTDPELLLRLEVAEEEGRTMWKYQPVRFSWRELNLRHSDTDVWHVDELVDRDRPMQNTPYVTGLTKRIP